MKKAYSSFWEFYPYYLSEHKNHICRRWHFFGSSLVILGLTFIILTQHWLYTPLLLIAGYGPAWIGHLFFEKNKPATFQHPFYSFMGDWVMYKDILVGKVKL